MDADMGRRFWAGPRVARSLAAAAFGAACGVGSAGESQPLLFDDECQRNPLHDESCAVVALQRRAQAKTIDVATGPAGCHDIRDDEPGPCMQAINWAKNVGYPKHPDWYPNIHLETAVLTDWQFKAWNTSHPSCPRPCNAQWDPTWCKAAAPPKLWAPASPVTPTFLNILSYNLFWWNLFKIHGGRSAGDLIKGSGDQHPYDVIGMQECEDANKVLGPPGLLDLYTAIHDPDKNICMAYRTKAWRLLAHGGAEVADDMRTEYYGRRSAQWMRLAHVESGLKVLFANHHGPLSVNSGGTCGGEATAANLLHVLASNAKDGDVLVLVGDFNANAASRTVQTLWRHLQLVQNSGSFGGVDNIFSNAMSTNIASTHDLGSGGSDHHAISAVLRFGPTASDDETVRTSSVASAEPLKTVSDLEHAQGSDACLLEPGRQYEFAAESWSEPHDGITDARVCCRSCMGRNGCLAWTWAEWSLDAKGPLCTLYGAAPSSSTAAPENFISGLPKPGAVAAAKGASEAAGTP